MYKSPLVDCRVPGEPALDFDVSVSAGAGSVNEVVEVRHVNVQKPEFFLMDRFIGGGLHTFGTVPA